MGFIAPYGIMDYNLLSLRHNVAIFCMYYVHSLMLSLFQLCCTYYCIFLTYLICYLQTTYCLLSIYYTILYLNLSTLLLFSPPIPTPILICLFSLIPYPHSVLSSLLLSSASWSFILLLHFNHLHKESNYSNYFRLDTHRKGTASSIACGNPMLAVKQNVYSFAYITLVGGIGTTIKSYARPSTTSLLRASSLKRTFYKGKFEEPNIKTPRQQRIFRANDLYNFKSRFKMTPVFLPANS